jgi:hypothetical protein
LCPAKLSFKSEEQTKIKRFKKKLRDFVPSKLSLEEMLRKFYREKEKQYTAVTCIYIKIGRSMKEEINEGR